MVQAEYQFKLFLTMQYRTMCIVGVSLGEPARTAPEEIKREHYCFGLTFT